MSHYVGAVPYKNSPCPVRFRHNDDEMSTAIVSVYTPDGFVIGADGRRINEQSGVVDSETTQKITGFKLKRFKAAYAWSGITTVTLVDGREFDYKIASDCVLNAIDDSVGSFSNLIRRFGDGLYALLISFFGTRFPTVTPGDMARVLFVGS
jgi:hypothetical protein